MYYVAIVLHTAFVRVLENLTFFASLVPNCIGMTVVSRLCAVCTYITIDNSGCFDWTGCGYWICYRDAQVARHATITSTKFVHSKCVKYLNDPQYFPESGTKRFSEENKYTIGPCSVHVVAIRILTAK